MILCSFDFETTGLDKQKDRIIEVGYSLYTTTYQRILSSESFLVDNEGVPISVEAAEKTHITPTMLDRFGFDQEAAVDKFCEYAKDADAIIGHNSNWFDLPFIRNTATRLDYDPLPCKISIDTMTDIPGVKGEKLVTMCANHGFLNPFPHSALADAQSVLKLISFYDIDKVAERAISPTIIMLSHQDRGTAANKAARKAGFRWNGDFKIWWQAVQEMDIEQLAARVPFTISRASKEISLEQLRED